MLTDAVSMLAVAMGLLIMLLALFLPLYAALSIRRRRRSRPTSSCWFGYTVIVGWAIALAAFAVWLLQGNGYGENGMTPRDLYQGAVVLGIVIAIYVVLTITGKTPEEPRGGI